MGESIAEGTIVRWIKKVGDKVDRDEPLFEISTDKVDAESPVAGRWRGLGDPRQGRRDSAGEQRGRRDRHGGRCACESGGADRAHREGRGAAEGLGSGRWRRRRAAAASALSRSRRTHLRARSLRACRRIHSTTRSPVEGRPAANGSTEDAIRERSSPLVRKIAKEHNVDIAQIRGTGIAGRVTKDDILGYIDKGAGGRDGQDRQEGRDRQEGVGRSEGQGAKPASVSGAPPVATVTFKPGENDHVEKMSVMRKRIAEHMVLSKKTSAHVHSVFEVNFGRIAKIRDAKKAEFERSGAKLTYMSFIIKAAIDALRAVPIVNASWTATTSSFTRTSTSASRSPSTGG
jgi:Pyruvate/2-oxoglutarate dehydrogenase complex, dihydrolipoamide acyltransferase (E2) component, and related enzymes